MTEECKVLSGGLRLKRFKLLAMQGKPQTFYTKSLDFGYGVDLSTARSLYKLGIHGVSKESSLSSGATKLLPLGDLQSDGSYKFVLHCHGENILGGEEFASAVLQASATNAYINASVENNILTFTSRSSQTLLPTGRLRGANNEIFTAMFKFSAPENTGTIIGSAIAFTFTVGMQNISYAKSYSGETVQMAVSSNATRQVITLSIANSTGKKRIFDLSTFGIFRGTKTAADFEPYWGEKTPFFLSEPLRSFDDAEDIAYPLQGYTMRNVRAVAYAPSSIDTASLDSAYPIYKLPLPDALFEKELRLDHFTSVQSTDELIQAAHRYMRTADEKSILISADTGYSTPESFLSFFNGLGVNIEYKSNAPVIERFAPISLATRAGRNYIDLLTEVAPGIVDFTYK